MSEAVVMPKLGDIMAFGVVKRWLKEDGSVVTAGEPLFEVDTDKVSVSVEAPGSGRLEQKVAEGVEVEIGEVVALLHPV